MTPAIREKIAAWVEQYVLPGSNVLEIGSRDVNGSVREFFELRHCPYFGIDLEPGPGVDVTGNAGGAWLPSQVGRKDVVVCLETLEHAPEFWKILQNVQKILAPGGLFFCSTPTIGFPYHAYPRDYYRFTEDAYRDVIFSNMEILELTTLTDPAGYPGILGLARKS